MFRRMCSNDLFAATATLASILTLGACDKSDQTESSTPEQEHHEITNPEDLSDDVISNSDTAPKSDSIHFTQWPIRGKEITFYERTLGKAYRASTHSTQGLYDLCSGTKFLSLIKDHLSPELKSEKSFIDKYLDSISDVREQSCVLEVNKSLFDFTLNQLAAALDPVLKKVATPENVSDYCQAVVYLEEMRHLDRPWVADQLTYMERLLWVSQSTTQEWCPFDLTLNAELIFAD